MEYALVLLFTLFIAICDREPPLHRERSERGAGPIDLPEPAGPKAPAPMEQGSKFMHRPPSKNRRTFRPPAI